MLNIGMFGTCGGSKWREPFKARYEELGIPFFDPNKENWRESDAIEEAQHLAEDDVILFPITKETYGTGSLSEVGFSILQAIRLDDRRDFVVMIDQELVPELDNPTARQESLRARALVMQHLKKLRLKNIYIVDNLADMLDVSIKLFEAAKLRAPLSVYNPHNR
ncbi:hypothetical protein [Minisyncoccus archaeiphilus]|uniref:hypothetical protein n=1 Tax=Minisyncoccus archaeiphilus TaxID=3238481 RepID=UPI00399C9F6A